MKARNKAILWVLLLASSSIFLGLAVEYFKPSKIIEVAVIAVFCSMVAYLYDKIILKIFHINKPNYFIFNRHAGTAFLCPVAFFFCIPLLNGTAQHHSSAFLTGFILGFIFIPSIITIIHYIRS